MNFTYTDFAKAAKRLADADGIKLSQAQEKLSSLLGYKNHHAAQQALQRSSVTLHASGAASSYVGRLWRGLTWMQTFELLTLGARFEVDNMWGVRALDLLRMVSADIFSLPSTEPVSASEISDGLKLMSILRRAKEIQELAQHQEMARHHALLHYASTMQSKNAPRVDASTAAAMEQHSYLTMQIAPALSTLFLLESSNASTAEVMAMCRQLNSDSADPVQQMLALESHARFMRPTQVA